MTQFNNMGKRFCTGAVLTAAMLLQPCIASAKSLSVGALQGSWEVTLAGTTGCGQSSFEATFTLNPSGLAADNMTLVTHGQCGDSTTSDLIFEITSLNKNGSGTANLFCNADTAICGWNLAIQVAPDGNSFSVVDVNPGNPGNFVSGMAIRQ